MLLLLITVLKVLVFIHVVADVDLEAFVVLPGDVYKRQALYGFLCCKNVKKNRCTFLSVHLILTFINFLSYLHALTVLFKSAFIFARRHLHKFFKNLCKIAL